MKRFGIVVALAVILVLLGACSKGSDSNVFDLAAEGGSVKASLIDDGNYGYVLRIEGTGAVLGYGSKSEAPWYKVSGRITGIEVPEGITGLGDNLFCDCVYLRSVVLPKTVKSIGGSTFSPKTAICAYAEVSAPENVKIYLYSEDKPTDGGLYWRLKSGKVDLWDLTKILFIGNSFTYYNDMDQIVARIASGAGENVSVQRVTVGSYNLTKFANEKDEGGAQVYAALRAASDYDIVVLQEQSTRPLTNLDLFKEGAKALVKLVEETQEDCKVYLYQTWGFPAGATGTTVPQMEQGLYDAYSIVATELSLGLCPVGRAFTKVYSEHPEIVLYNEDGRHPSAEGSYLAACVHAAKLLGVDPRGIDVGDYAYEDVLSQAAYDIVFGK